MRMNSKRFLIVLGASLVVHLVFINKAYHIDDPLFIYAARQILEDPTDPYAAMINWSGEVKRMADFFSNPPGLSYYLAFIIFCFGENEVIIHLAMIPFSLLALLFSIKIFQHFTNKEWQASLVLLCSPIFLVSMTNVMPDIAMLAFFLGAVYFFISGFENRIPALVIISGIFMSVAIMLRYNAIVLIPMVICYALLSFQPKKMSYLVTLVLPISTFLIWNVYSMNVYGSPHFIGQMEYQDYGFKWMTIIENLGANLSYLTAGTASLSVYASVKILRSPRKSLVFFVGVILIVVFGCIFFLMSYDLFHTLISTVFVYSSAIVLLFTALKLFEEKRPIKENQQLFLLFWILGVLLMHFSGIHTATKYIILVLPPFIILILNQFTFKYLNAVLLVSLTIGLASAIVDFQHATAYREFARDVSRDNSLTNGYFTGHWGYQFYLEEAGFENHLKKTTSIAWNKGFITTSLAWPRKIDKGISDVLQLKEQVIVESPVPIRIMHNADGAHANFYSNNVYPGKIGFLPFSFSTHPIDTLSIYEATNLFSD